MAKIECPTIPRKREWTEHGWQCPAGAHPEGMTLCLDGKTSFLQDLVNSSNSVLTPCPFPQLIGQISFSHTII